MMTSDREERARVKSRIGSLILRFCATQLALHRSFFMEELRQFVEEELRQAVAPDSPGRILRQLRQQHLLNYMVVSRGRSLYRMKPVERPAGQAKLFQGVS